MFHSKAVLQHSTPKKKKSTALQEFKSQHSGGESKESKEKLSNPVQRFKSLKEGTVCRSRFYPKRVLRYYQNQYRRILTDTSFTVANRQLTK